MTGKRRLLCFFIWRCVKKGKRMDITSYINAFWVGGLICAAVQILLEKTKLLPGRIMVLLVCLGAVLSFVGVYEPFVEFAGAGATVPLIGFGNVLMKGVKEAVDQDGFLRLTEDFLIIDIIPRVTGMADDIHIRVFHDL